jgi:hypothetical protein
MKFPVVISAVLALSVTPVLACSMNKSTSASLPVDRSQTTASVTPSETVRDDAVLASRRTSAAEAPIVIE